MESYSLDSFKNPQEKHTRTYDRYLITLLSHYSCRYRIPLFACQHREPGIETGRKGFHVTSLCNFIRGSDFLRAHFHTRSKRRYIPRTALAAAVAVIVILFAEYRWFLRVHLPSSFICLSDSRDETDNSARGGGRRAQKENSSRREVERRSFNDMPYSSCLACGPYYLLTEGDFP